MTATKTFGGISMSEKAAETVEKAEKKKPKTAKELHADLIARVVEITPRTPEQDELLRLENLSRSRELTTKEKRDFGIYTKAVRSNFRASDAMDAVKLLAIGAKKARDHNLIELGGLVVGTGMDVVETEVFTGMLLGMRKRFDILTSESAGTDGAKSADAKTAIEKYRKSGIDHLAKLAREEKERRDARKAAAKAKETP
jgi:hypothetical protein